MSFNFWTTKLTAPIEGTTGANTYIEITWLKRDVDNNLEIEYVYEGTNADHIWTIIVSNIEIS
jgi:hypothetical protein